MAAHHRILDHFVALGHLSAEDLRADSADRPSTQLFGCMSCRRPFGSRGGEGAHMFKAHGICNRVRKLFNTTTCPACLKEYFPHGKVKTTSFTQNIAVGPSSAADTLLTLLEVGDLRKIVAWPTLTSLYCLHCKARGQCYRQYLGKKFFTTSSLERTSTRHLLKEKTFRHPGHLNRSSETRSTPAVYRGHRVLLHWHTSIEHITIEDAEAIGLAHGDIIYVLQYLNTGAAWSFLRDERRHGPPCEAVEQIHTILERESASPRGGPLHEASPRPFGRHRYVLHAFSGRRRLGDFQHYLDRAGSTEDGFVLHTISLDLVVDACWGDVSRIETRNFWLQGIREGFVTSLLAGPPCETWSKARGVAIPGRWCPRILRLIEALWGMDSLTLRELRQLGVGNLLLRFTILKHWSILRLLGVTEFWNTPPCQKMRTRRRFGAFH